MHFYINDFIYSCINIDNFRNGLDNQERKENLGQEIIILLSPLDTNRYMFIEYLAFKPI